ncbi:hypothetical protein, partial [Xanthomonas oryzae]
MASVNPPTSPITPPATLTRSLHTLSCSAFISLPYDRYSVIDDRIACTTATFTSRLASLPTDSCITSSNWWALSASAMPAFSAAPPLPS